MFNFSKNKNRIIRSLPSTGGNERIISSRKKEKFSGLNKGFWMRALLVILSVCLAGATVYTLFFSSLLQIKSVIVDDLADLNSQDIIVTANDIMQQRYFNTWNKSNLILLNTGEIKKALLEKFKKIESVEITKKFPDQLLISIKERESSLVFCSGDACFVIDRDGRAYAPANFQFPELGEQNLMILRDLSQKNISMNNIAIDENVINFMGNIKNKFNNDLSLDIKQEWSTPALISGDLRLETAEGWKIYLNLDISADKEIEMLKTTLNNSIDKTKRADLDYIDLRLDNKVYYKLKTAPIVDEENKDAVPVVKVEDVKNKKKK
jgi:cell division septal protein FtsQ